MTLAIRTEDLVKDHGDVRALDGLSLSVEQGEFFGLLGPNGAGKTAFINTLVGLARATGGTAASSTRWTCCRRSTGRCRC